MGERDIYAECGEVSVEEAHEIATRFNNSHWKLEPYARYSIPANPRRDDDIRLSAFIKRAEAAFKRLDEIDGKVT